MAKMTPERELELIYKALGNRADASLWPSRMSAPAAVQRLVNTRNEDIAKALAKSDGEWDQKFSAAEDAHTQAMESKTHELNARIAKLESELESTKKSALDWMNKFQEADNETTSLREEINTLNIAVDKAEELVNKFEADLDEVKTSLSMEEDRTARLQRELAEARSESVFAVVSRAQESVRSLREKVEEKLGLR